MRRNDILSLIIANVTWLILLLENLILNIEIALILASIWGIGTMMFNIRIICKYGITIKHK